MRIASYCFFIILPVTICCCGQKSKKVKAKKPPVTITSDSIPAKMDGWVSDYEGVFTPAQKSQLNDLINEHEKNTTNEVAIATFALDSNKIKTSEDFSKFSVNLFSSWGVGKKDKYNGIGILISITLRRIRIEVGNGLQTKLTNEESAVIVDTIILPEFQKGDYYAGLLKALQAIFKEIQ